jgi:hypothetical protein
VQRFRASGHLFPFFRRIQKKNESVRFAHFQFASIIKRIHLSPKEGSRERERVRVRFSPHKRESRASDLRSKKRNSEKKRNSRLLESALKERKAFISVLRFFPRHQRKKRSSQKQKKKKTRNLAGKDTKRGKSARLLKRKIWTKKYTKNTDDYNSNSRLHYT